MLALRRLCRSRMPSRIMGLAAWVNSLAGANYRGCRRRSSLFARLGSCFNFYLLHHQTTVHVDRLTRDVA